MTPSPPTLKLDLHARPGLSHIWLGDQEISAGVRSVEIAATAGDITAYHLDLTWLPLAGEQWEYTGLIRLTGVTNGHGFPIPWLVGQVHAILIRIGQRPGHTVVHLAGQNLSPDLCNLSVLADAGEPAIRVQLLVRYAEEHYGLTGELIEAGP